MQIPMGKHCLFKNYFLLFRRGFLSFSPRFKKDISILNHTTEKINVYTRFCTNVNSVNSKERKNKLNKKQNKTTPPKP